MRKIQDLLMLEVLLKPHASSYIRYLDHKDKLVAWVYMSLRSLWLMILPSGTSPNSREHMPLAHSYH